MEIKRYKENLKAEWEASLLYRRIAVAEPNKDLAAIYVRLAETEERHAGTWVQRLRQAGVEPPEFSPSIRTRLFSWMARKYGSASIVGMISAIETRAAGDYDDQSEATAVGMNTEERSHARVFNYLARTTGGMEGSDVARVEGRHRAGGNALRAGVLGANDGLVSVFCLVMGVAGAGVPQREILITGFAGLLAGALSMALGEWLSVQSSRELYGHQLSIEERELAEVPEEEKEELALIYQAKGLDGENARALADKLLSDKATALDTLAREELAIDPHELGGSAWEAAITSFFLFALGAIIPVVAFVLWSGLSGVVASSAFAATGLFILGAASSLMTGRNWLFAGGRMVLFGMAAAAVTFGIGGLIGVSV
ncbi:MAG: rubrerythrin family protein [Spirochaetales bacterium]|nr:MAG: rubrerythrin family protein [Spirochaetales bacterium]